MGYVIRIVLGAALLLALGFGGWFAFQAVFGGGKNKQPAAIAALRCPPFVTVPPAPAGTAPIELDGLRLGFSVADVENTVKCRGKDYKIAFQPIWHTPVEDARGVRQLMYARRGYEVFTAGLAGAPNEERVVALWREIGYPPDAPAPQTQSVIDGLTALYGPAHESKVAGLKRELWWLYDSQGAPLKSTATENNPFTAFGRWATESIAIGACKGHVALDSMEAPTWNGACGTTILVEIESRDDGTTALRMRAALMDQAKLGGAVTRYRAARDAARSTAPSAAAP
ncbi:MAG: hypothetical protein AB7M12_07420 [Hyphomonadaceae bacterium]